MNTSSIHIEGMSLGGAVGPAPRRKRPEFHAPQREAAMFYGMFLRGRPAEALRAEIDISPQLLRRWMRNRDFDPSFREDLRHMYFYRKQVLAIFESLVTSDRSNRDRQ